MTKGGSHKGLQKPMQQREEQLLIITFKRWMARHNRSHQVDCPKVSKLSNQHIHKMRKLQTDYFLDAQVLHRFKHRCKEGVNTLNKSLQIQTANQKAWTANCRKLEEYNRTFKKSLLFFYISSNAFMIGNHQKKTHQRKNTSKTDFYDLKWPLILLENMSEFA